MTEGGCDLSVASSHTHLSSASVQQLVEWKETRVVVTDDTWGASDGRTEEKWEKGTYLRSRPDPRTRPGLAGESLCAPGRAGGMVSAHRILWPPRTSCRPRVDRTDSRRGGGGPARCDNDITTACLRFNLANSPLAKALFVYLFFSFSSSNQSCSLWISVYLQGGEGRGGEERKEREREEREREKLSFIITFHF